MIALFVGASCGGGSASSVASVIEDGASRLQSGGMTQATVSYAPSDRMPYVLVIYPSVRNEADERLLDEMAPKAAELGPAGAGVSPKSPGLTNTVALWRRGSLATFSGSFVSAAKAARLLAVSKPDGSPTEIVLSRLGSEVQIIQMR